VPSAGGRPAEPRLVWCANGHACKEAMQEWVPMGWHFQAMSGTNPFVIDQTVTVTFEGEPRPWVQELLAALGETLGRPWRHRRDPPRPRSHVAE
jgi:hypothetical protein